MGRRSTKAARDAVAAPSFDTVGMTILPGRALPEWAEPVVEDVAAPEAEADEALEAFAELEAGATAEQVSGAEQIAAEQAWAATTAERTPAAAGAGAPEPAYAMAGAAMAGAAMGAAAPPAPPAGVYAPPAPAPHGASPAGAPAGAYGTPPAPGPTGHGEPTYAPPGAPQPGPAYAEPSRYPAAPAAGLAAAAGAATTATGAATAPPATAAAPDTGYAPAGYGYPAPGQPAPGQAAPAPEAGPVQAAAAPQGAPAPPGAPAPQTAPGPQAGPSQSYAAGPPGAQMTGAQMTEPGMAATGTQTLTSPAPAPTDPAGMGQPSQAPTSEPGAAPSQVWGSPERPELSPEHVALLSWWADMIAAGNFPAPPGAPGADDTLEPPPSRPTKGRGRRRGGNTEGSARERSFPTKAVVVGLAAVVALGAAVVMGPKVLASQEPIVVPATELTMPATVGDLVAMTNPAIGPELQPLIGFGLRPAGVTVTAAYGPTAEGPLTLAAMSTRVGAPAEPVGQIATWAARSGVTTSQSVAGSGADEGITCAAAEATAAIPAGSFCVWTGSGMRGQTFSVEFPVEDAMALTAELRAGTTRTDEPGA